MLRQLLFVQLALLLASFTTARLSGGGRHLLSQRKWKNVGGAPETEDPNGAAGAIVTLTQSGLSFASSSILAPLLKNELGNLKLPDIDTEKDGVKIKINNIRTQDFKCDDCISVALDPTSSAVILTVGQFDIGIHSRYDLHKIISTGGECDSTVHHATLTGNVAIGISSDGHPTLSIDDVEASIDDVDLGCKGISGSILDAFADVFKKSVLDALRDAATGAVPPAIKQISDNLAKVQLDIPITNNFAEIRFDLSAAPAITANAIAAPTLGTVVPTSVPGQVAPYSIPTLPQYDSSESAYVQLFLSDFTLNTAAYTYWKAGRLSQVIPPTAVPASFPIQLNTSSLGAYAPGLLQKYPTAVPVQLVVAADPLTKPTIALNATTDLQVTLPSLVSFQALPSGGTPEDAFTLTCPVAAAGTLSIKGSAVAGSIATANCTLTEYNSTVGQVDVASLNALIGLVLSSAVVPEINKYAGQGIPIPTYDGYKLSNSRLKFYDSYVVVATDFAPTSAAEEEKELTFVKQ